MSWEISHSVEAWESVRKRLSLKKWIPHMRTALENRAFDSVEGLNDPQFKVEVKRIKALSHQDLVDETMAVIEEHNTCSSGGHEFYLDAEGYERCPCDELSPWEKRWLPDWAV